MEYNEISFLINGRNISFKLNKEKTDDRICDSFNVDLKNGAYFIERTIKNTSNDTLKLTELSYKLLGKLGDDLSKDFYYTPENIRLYSLYSIPVDFDRTCKNKELNKKMNLGEDTIYADPDTLTKRILASPYCPFPGVLIGNYSINEGMVFGSLSQDYFAHNLIISHNDNKLEIDIYSTLKGLSYRELKPNEKLTDRFYLGSVSNTKDINGLFKNYVDELNQILKDNTARSSVNRHELIWDSWNDGIYRNINENMLLEEAKAYKKYFKNAAWFQVDDGYSSYCEENVDLDAHGLGVPYEKEEGIDKNKFPNGLKHFSDEISKLGLKPAIWVGGLCPVKSKIYKERKEWFFDMSYRLDFSMPLDYSIMDARNYMKSAMNTFVDEYGFKGIKHDFWSYTFEEKHDVLRYKTNTGYEYRKDWGEYLRNLVKEDGYLQASCDIGIANPFLGKYFNNYRFGIDIGAGKFSNIKTTFKWAVGVLSTHTGHLFIPNSDSAGLLPNLNDTDFMFALNMQIITRTLVEISGRFSKVDSNNGRLKKLIRATNYLNNGEEVYFVNFDYLNSSKKEPSIIMLNSSFDSPSKDYKTIGLFNDTEEELDINLNLSDIGICGKTQIEDVWSENSYTSDKIYYKLAPHGSKLLKIKC